MKLKATIDGIFGLSRLRVIIPKNYAEQRPLPFFTPPILSNSNETYYLSLKRSQYSSAFSIRPQGIRSGQQFDIILLDKNTFRNTSSIALQVFAKSETKGRVGSLKVICTVLDEAPKRIFESSEYRFQLPLPFTAGPVGYIKLINAGATNSTHFTLYGSMAKHFNIEQKGDVLVLKSSECFPGCSSLPENFALVLRGMNANSLQIYDVSIYISLNKVQEYNEKSQFRNNALTDINRNKTVEDEERSQKQLFPKLAGGSSNNFSKRPPKFKQPLWVFTLKEKTTSDEILFLEADDPDSSTLLYTLMNHNDVFEVDKNYGVLSIVAAGELTIEKFGEHFNLTVAVSDENNQTDTTVVMVTLKPRYGDSFSGPSFSQEIYAFAAQPGVKYIGQVSADVSNGKLTFRLSEGGAKLFSINATDGRIYYEGPLEKNAHNYTLKLLVLDDSTPPKVDVSTAQILIAGLESSPPNFITSGALAITINKDLLSGTMLHKFVAKDDDLNAKLQYSVESLNVIDEIGSVVPDSLAYMDFFTFENNGNDNGSLYLSKSFTNTTVLAIELTVKVVDVRHPLESGDRVKFVIQFMTPEKQISKLELLQFPNLPYTILVSEDIPVGSYIYTVNVKPAPTYILKNYQIIYTLSEGQRYFAVNSITGVITTISSLRVLKKTNLKVIATMLESQRSAVTTLQVVTIPSQRRHLPDFAADSFVFTLVENIPIGSTINGSIVQSVRNNVSYDIQGKDWQYVTVDKQGILYTAKDIDREQKSQLTTFVRALKSNGQFSLVPVTINVIDEDDAEPIFSNRSYVASVMENSPINTFIVHAKATDDDNSELDYSLMMNADSAKLSSLLRVDERGTIYNVEPLLGYSGDYQFAIIARDRRHSGASATIFLTIIPYTKCQPVFPPNMSSVFEIEENQVPLKMITQIAAQVPDKNCKLHYALWNGQEFLNYYEPFFLNASSGELFATKSFDFETTDRYPLMIVARSGESYEQLDIEIRIVDVDDNEIEIIDKELYYKIREDEKPGKKIGKIRAFDKDPSNTVYFHMLGETTKFNVGLTDGVITLVSKVDREVRESYLLRILVTNQDVLLSADLYDNSATAFVHIEIIDVNDNGPIFEKSLYTVAVQQDSLAGKKLLTVKAKDPDFCEDSESGTVLYRVEDTIYKHLGKIRQADGFITIGERTGDVTFGRSPRGFNGGLFECKIASSDSPGSEAHLAYTQLKVWLYESKNVIEMEVDQNPKNLNVVMMQKQLRQISELTHCEAHFLSLRNIKLGDHFQRQPFRVQFILINETAGKLLNSDEAISLVDKHAFDNKLSKPQLFASQQTAHSIESHNLLTTKSSEVTLLLGVFIALLGLVFAIFSCILCYHRAKYLREKRLYEDKKIALGALNKNNRYKQPPPVILPPKHTLWEKHGILLSDNNYAMQEAMITVEAESPLKRSRLPKRQEDTAS